MSKQIELKNAKVSGGQLSTRFCARNSAMMLPKLREREREREKGHEAMKFVSDSDSDLS